MEYCSCTICHVSWELGGANRIFCVVLFCDDGVVLSSAQSVEFC